MLSIISPRTGIDPSLTARRERDVVYRGDILTINAATLVFFAAATGTGIVAADFGFLRHISDFALFQFHHQRFHSTIKFPVLEQFSHYPNGTIQP